MPTNRAPMYRKEHNCIVEEWYHMGCSCGVQIGIHLRGRTDKQIQFINEDICLKHSKLENLSLYFNPF